MYNLNIKRKIARVCLIALLLLSVGFELQQGYANGIYIRGIDPFQGSPGTKARIFGGGATPEGIVEAVFEHVEHGDPVVVVNQTVGWTVADVSGLWEVIFIVPEVPLGNSTVYVVDNETLTGDAIGFGVLLAQEGIRILHISPLTGSVGTTVYVSGYGATAKGIVMLYLDEIWVANITAYDWGDWSTSFQVPNVSPGNHLIAVFDITSNTTDTVMFNVTPPPTIYVYPQEAPIGSKITVSGEGFTRETGLYLMFEDLMFFTFIYVDENGEFNATIFVPVVNSGNYTIRALGLHYYDQSPKTFPNVGFRVTMGLDTLFEKIDEVQNAINQTQSNVQTVNDEASLANIAANSAKDEASAAKNAAESAETMAAEARIYGLTAMIFAFIATALSVLKMIKKK